MNAPNPALVTERAAQRLPRVALLLFCAAYLLPGLFGRDPWKNADITAFGYMANIAQGYTSWWEPTVGGLAGDAALLPYWLGAISIKLLSPWLLPELAARLPFAMLLGLVLLWTWYSTYHLARTEAAQPLPFAFGGEANPIDYARAIADGALLAVIASLGLLEAGHETTPELVQLAGVALYMYALAASPYRTWQSRLAVLVALPAIAASNAPGIALMLGLVGTVVCARSSYEPARRFVPWVIAATVLGAIVATLLNAWAVRLSGYEDLGDVWSLVRMLAWFTWPTWPMALWTLWRWRNYLTHRHISVPLGCMLVGVIACIAMGGSDRALMLALPPLAVLAAFALPTLHRGTSAAIDWFSVFFFSILAMAAWFYYVVLQTGEPARAANSVTRLVPGFTPKVSFVAIAIAALATLAWLWLVRWRTGRNRHPLWKSLVLPASGVALGWLLAMTLFLPAIDYNKSYRALVNRVAQHVPSDACIAAPRMPRGQVAALEYFGAYRVDAVTPEAETRCEFLLLVEKAGQPGPTRDGWSLVARERRPADRTEVTAIYRRNPGGFPAGS